MENNIGQPGSQGKGLVAVNRVPDMGAFRVNISRTRLNGDGIPVAYRLAITGLRQRYALYGCD